MPPLRIRLGRILERDAQRHALWLAMLAQSAFERWRQYVDGELADVGEIGSPLGSTPDETVANLRAFLADTADMLKGRGPPPSTSVELRGIAVIRDATEIERELGKGAAANPIVAGRADLLRRDVWDRFRAGEGLVRPATPLEKAIDRLTDAAVRLATHGTAIQVPPTSPAAETSSDRGGDTGDALAVRLSVPDPAVSSLPTFSQIEDEYATMRRDAGASNAAISTIHWRVGIFKSLMGDRPINQYRPKDLQDYVNLLQYLPVEYSREGDNAEALRAMSPREAIEKNRAAKCWEQIGLKTMQDGYVQVIKTIFSHAVGHHEIRHPFAGLRIRWPDNAKPSVQREALDFERLDSVFRLGVESGNLDDAILPPLAFLSSRRIGLLAWTRGSDIREKHGVYVVRVNGIVFDAATSTWRRVPYKTYESLTFFVLHDLFRKIGFVDWAMAQGDAFLFRQIHTCKDPADVASKRINALLRRAGATGRDIEVGHSLRHGSKDLMVDEDIGSEATRLQMGHELGGDGAHGDYGTRAELRRKQCVALAKLPLPKEIDWSVFEGLDIEAMASKVRKGGRPKK